MSGEAGTTTVCVTGGSGYIGSWIVKLLLQHDDHTAVRATVRDLKDPRETEHLLALQGAKDRLQLYETELVDEGCFDSVVDGCEFVFHVASPVKVDSSKPEAEVIDPAVKGTLNVLKACAKASSVKRVVLTSSIATVLVTGKPLSSQSFVDETWFSDPQFCRDVKYWYSLSKILAERAALEFAKENGMDLVVINPGMVIGPSLHSNSNYSMGLIMDLTKGENTYETYCFVDVRDVAYAHIQAAKLPSASGRYFLVERVLVLSEVLRIINDIDPTLSPKSCNEDMKATETVHTSGTFKVSTRAKDLGVELMIPVETSIKDTIISLREVHQLK